MRYNLHKIELKNGQSCTLRSPEKEDAESVLNHLKITSDETEYMFRTGDEICMSIEEEKEYLEKTVEDEKSIMISAMIDGKIVANAGFCPASEVERCRHRAEFGISIQKPYWGSGIGSAIMEAIIESARKARYELLELEVVCGNARGFALYKKFGFEIYGIRKHAMKYRNGNYCSMYLMQLVL